MLDHSTFCKIISLVWNHQKSTGNQIVYLRSILSTGTRSADISWCFISNGGSSGLVIKMPFFHIFNTLKCPFKPNQKCQRDMNDPVCTRYYHMLTLVFIQSQLALYDLTKWIIHFYTIMSSNESHIHLKMKIFAEETEI